MTTIKCINEIKDIGESVVTIGNFDGPHKGHQVLISKTIEYAKLNNIKSVVFTFENHPANYFVPNVVKNIVPNDEKIKRLKALGADYVINIPFDNFMTKISAYDFVKDILISKLNAKKIIVGYDFNFARNKEGNTNVLRELSSEFGFELEVVKPIKINGVRVSSTLIRDLILQGNVYEVGNYLGYSYELSGKVIHARKLGRTIGFPTANIEINEDVVIPKGGIYATKVHIDDEIFYGATNIGYNPTVNGQRLSIETNILDFDRDIYGEIIKLEFLERTRDEKKFSSIEELKNQLEKDTSYIYEKYVCKKAEYMIR
ncbi:MAG: bifunctional riboflavin kinase/FAD synthetase [Peptostreptococcaceae bacterium]